MSSFNKVILMGNLTRDVDLKYTPNGSAVARITVATSRKYRDQKSNELREETTYVDVEAWGKPAETIAQYMSKGKPILIEGRLKQDSWDDKTTGKKVYKMKVACETFQFMGGSGAAAASTEQRQKPHQQRPAPAQKQSDGFGDESVGGGDIPEENIPF